MTQIDFDDTDEDLDLDGGAAPNPSMLQELEAELQAQVSNPAITRRVRSRKNTAIRYDPNIDARTLTAWRKRCTPKSGRVEDIDLVKLAGIVINNTAECVVFKGEDAHDRDGLELNFRNGNLRPMLGTTDAFTTVRRFFGNDAQMIAHMTSILSAAGYDDEISDDDEAMDDDPFE